MNRMASTQNVIYALYELKLVAPHKFEKMDWQLMGCADHMKGSRWRVSITADDKGAVKANAIRVTLHWPGLYQDYKPPQGGLVPNCLQGHRWPGFQK